VLEHLPYPGRTLQFLHRKLKKGGFIFIAVPNNSFWRKFYLPSFLLFSEKRKLEVLIEPISYDGKFKEIHLMHFTPKSLKRIIEQNGFEIKELTMDNFSLNPGNIKDLKYYLRNIMAKYFHVYTHKALFMCAQKI
jgi:SAM-dependent methyltransferase